jgi:hypothetical protein
MNGITSIVDINAGTAIHRRALAYATNNPGVSTHEAIAHLTKRDAKATRTRDSLNSLVARRRK